MPPRFFVDRPLGNGSAFELPAGPARHVQVLRLQPGDALVLFDGRGGEWAARVGSIGRHQVEVRLVAHDPVERELAVAVTLALGMPANDRMDFVVEKATELGAARIQPLVCERSVLRPDGARAEKKVAHWQAVAAAAAEQSGRTRVPPIEPVRGFGAWIDALGAPAEGGRRCLLDPTAIRRWADHAAGSSGGGAVVLSGPEGGCSPTEVAAARAAGFVGVTLGRRVLRADTAPLAALAWLALSADDGTCRAA